MLKIKDLDLHYGGIHALKKINIDIPKNKIVTLIGSNGAGKTSTLRSIVGLEKISSGKIEYEGLDISGEQTKDIITKGIVLVPEGRRIFLNLTVEENLILGAYTRKNKKEIDSDLKWVYELFPRLKERLWQKAGTMSGGEQQMLAVGRALMTKPKLLIMDEPSLGLAPLIVKDIFNIIKEIKNTGMTILLVEQNAKAALKIADYAYVLETGNIVLEGEGHKLSEDENVRKAYLGEEVI